MKYTGNYNLKKPEGNDAVNIEDFNDNADIIDAELKKIDNKAESIEVPVTKVNDKVGDVVLKASDIKLENGTTIENKLSEVDTSIEDVQQDIDEHLADYAYQTPTIVGTQIRISKQSNTNRLYFKLDNDLVGGITISLDGGVTSKPLQDFEGVQLTELEKGFVEVIANASFFTLIPKGGKKVADVDYIITSQGGQFFIPKGVHSGNGIVKAQFANLTSANIRSGINVGGVVGELAPVRAIQYRITGLRTSGTQVYNKTNIELNTLPIEVDMIIFTIPSDGSNVGIKLGELSDLFEGQNRIGSIYKTSENRLSFLHRATVGFTTVDMMLVESSLLREVFGSMNLTTMDNVLSYPNVNQYPTVIYEKI